MNSESQCPDNAQLQAMLDETLADPQRSTVQQHVDSCERCRRELERWETEDGSLEQVADSLRQTPSPDPALQEAMERLKSQASDETSVHKKCEEISLEFLQPSGEPGSLGRLGQYEIREVVGRGGMGVVLKASDTKLNRTVAIKVLAPELAANAAARKRFLREARAAAAVNHPHVVSLFAVAEDELPYLVVEYVDGESLQQKINAQGPLELKEILRIGMQIAAGLAAAHQQGLIHRDVKPSNVLLENGVERVKLTDFGLARAVDDISITRTGEASGTPEYMSPEQADAKTVDPRSDLFSLGSVLYAMCTGRSPFRAESTPRVLRRVCDDRPRPLREVNPDVPQWLADLVDKLLEKDPNKRIQTAAEVEKLLGSYLAYVQDPSGTSLPQPIHLRKRKRRSRPWLIVAAAVLLLAGSLGLTEATGVTQLTSSVIRVVTGEGTLVIEVDDPAVSVTIDGRDLVITGAGPKEVRLRPGKYRVDARKDGEPLITELVTITRGGQRVVRVSGIADAERAVTPAERDAFVVLGAQGAEIAKFDTLAEAVAGSSAGDTIEVRGNGPFLTDRIDIKHALTIRAGDGFRPVIASSVQSQPGPSVHAKAPVVLEGLELQKLRSLGNFLAARDSLYAANCRFVPSAILSHEAFTVCNCEFLNPSSPAYNSLRWKCQSGRKSLVNNCVLTGDIALYNDDPALHDVELHVRRSTALGYKLIDFAPRELPKLPEPAGDGAPIRIRVSASLFDTRIGVFQFSLLYLPQGVTVPQAEELLPRLFQWHDEKNVYAENRDLLLLLPDQGPYEPIGKKGLREWNRFWGLTDTGSLQGPIRFEGGQLRAKLATAPGQLTPHDYRLRPDSAGCRAGPDGEDLGVDVDLVGPGEAYQRWKRTPDYQQWQRETRELMQAARAEQYAEAEQWDAARALYSKLIEGRQEEAGLFQGRGLHLDTADLHAWRGEVYEKLQRWDEAAADFCRALELRPAAWERWHARAKEYGNAQRWDAALALYAKLIEVKPEERVLFSGRGRIHVRLTNWEEAAEDFERAAELNPANWIHVAHLRLQMGDQEGYRLACLERLRWSGGTEDSGVARRTARVCLLAPGAVSNYALPLKLADEAVTRGSEFPRDSELVRGMVDYRTGQFAEAIEWFHKSLSGPTAASESPDGNVHRRASALLFLAMAHHRLGRTKEAEQFFAQASEIMGVQVPTIESGYIGFDWHGWLGCHIVLREAEELTGKNK